ncbi:myelin protein zero-like 1 like isoform X1 [Acanthochromis polyacanthus]|uniref:Myelin protein zero-like 1 like n=1 Tax=Acanthochromis polyacanthus TaxID=80966 RepID=A0A3Q1F1A6_9TELE|nr:myelin protein zero-like 1 like isoform X1 [Acanthochromis polyacanthus]
MEPKWSNTVCKRVLLTGFTLCVVFVTLPTSAIDIHADPEMIVQNGTTGVLRCTFKSSEVVSSATSVTWSFQSSQPDSQFSKAPYVIYYFSNGKGFPGPAEFKDRVQFVGDINKRDVSIQLSPTQFSDNGTFFCDVKNPPDIQGTHARTELRVVLKESLPPNNTALIIGIVCGALLLLVAIAVAACIAMRVLHNRHDYEGCTSLESVSSHAPQPRKKVESSLEGSRCTSPSGPLQVGAGGQRNLAAATISWRGSHLCGCVVYPNTHENTSVSAVPVFGSS